MIRIINDFAGASVGECRVQEGRVLVSLRRDPHTKADYISHDYNYHFIFGLHNQSSGEESPSVLVECQDESGLSQQGMIYCSRSLEQEFELADFPCLHDSYIRYCLKPVLAPGETLYLANTYFRPPQTIIEGFEDLARAGGAKARVYGKSLEGRDLKAYHYEDQAPENAPLVLISSGFHPPEPDTLASAAIMEYLASEAGQELRRQFRFVIAPLVNPDGFFLGTQGHNAAGINIYWLFAKDDPKNAPEAAALWELACANPPSLYFDFHAYTFQGARKHASPYIKPLIFYRGDEVKQAAAAINRNLLAYTGGKAMEGFATYAPSTLGAMLTQRFNTITYAKYHVHLADGVQACRKHGLEVVKIACQTLQDLGVRDQARILTRPQGVQRAGLWEGPKLALYRAWNGPIKHRLRPLAARLGLASRG